MSRVDVIEALNALKIVPGCIANITSAPLKVFRDA